MNKSYSEKLKNPLWQKKRLLIFSRDNWKCKICFSNTNQLHLHHIKYEKGIEPWESKDEHLITLCCDCHAKKHKKKKPKREKDKIKKVFLRKKKYKMWKDYKEYPKRKR